MKISHGRYYYRFQDVVDKLREEDDSCFICGSTKRVKPHHIQRVKESNPQYANEDNVVLLCPYHHHKFHQIYGSGKGVNRHNFNVFVKKEHLRRVKSLERKLNEMEEDTKEKVLSAINRERTCIGTNVLRQLAEELNIEVD